jgi:hypothetical protein
MVPVLPHTAPSDTTGEGPAMSALADAWNPTSLAVYSYIGSTGNYLQKGQFVHAISPLRLYNLWLEIAYICLQVLIVMLYKAVSPPKPCEFKRLNAICAAGSAQAGQTSLHTARPDRHRWRWTDRRIIRRVSMMPCLFDSSSQVRTDMLSLTALRSSSSRVCTTTSILDVTQS